MIYGFQPPEPDERDYSLGAVSKVINPSGNWLAYTPLGETQLKAIDPANCTGFALSNCLEILERFHFKNSVNYSDRFIGVNAGTYPPGNNPKTVMNKTRKAGLISEEKLPFENIKTIDEYYAPISNSLKKQGSKWLSKRFFNYELIVAPWLKVNRQKALMEGLKRSPISISANAWNKEEKYYIKRGRDNHNVVLIGYVENEYWLIFDSYQDGTSYLKKLDWDYAFEFAWIITLVKAENKPTIITTWANILADILKKLKSIIYEIKYMK